MYLIQTIKWRRLVHCELLQRLQVYYLVTYVELSNLRFSRACGVTDACFAANAETVDGTAGRIIVFPPGPTTGLTPRCNTGWPGATGLCTTLPPGTCEYKVLINQHSSEVTVTKHTIVPVKTKMVQKFKNSIIKQRSSCAITSKNLWKCKYFQKFKVPGKGFFHNVKVGANTWTFMHELKKIQHISNVCWNVKPYGCDLWWVCTQLSLYFSRFQTASIALEYMENYRKMTFLPTETAWI